MESIRVDICYRPLRIAWAICSGDLEGFRLAVRISHALWGGRFDPIVIVDQDGAEDLINLFRVDVIFPIGDSDLTRSFVKRFPHLSKPFYSDSIFVGDGQYGSPCQLLDIQNAISYWYEKPEWETFKKREFRLYTWKPEDPLADVFLMQLGEYPREEEGIATDYRHLVKRAAQANEIGINPASKLPADVFEHPSISFLSRWGLEAHYSVRSGWDGPGFYSGDAGNLTDLVCFWNLRAANIPLLFVDPKRIDRYGETIASWGKGMQQLVSRRTDEYERNLAVWSIVDDATNTQEGMKAILDPFQGKAASVYRVPRGTLSDSGIRPPMMFFSEVSTLGIVGNEVGKIKISFALEQKPFDTDVWFHPQNLVASISFIGGLYGDEHHTLIPPFVPELNGLYARAMHLHDKFRIEPGRLGLVVDPHDHSTFIHALSVADLVENIFGMIGFSAKISESGLIARQLIAQVGGVDSARPFKIPGVRRLIKTHGPTDSFTKSGAVQLIGGKDPQNPSASFKDYHYLYIEPRPHESTLTPHAVFEYLVEKGLFRIGAELRCPNCRLLSWTALDDLKQKIICELCGREFDATRQLIGEDWHYRRSGVLGKERNAQGAVPVVLTLQQFKSNFHAFTEDMYYPSLDLVPKAGFDLPSCEIDFLWIDPRPYPDRTMVMIGECKDSGGGRKDSGTINARDIENLRQVADALPRKRFQTYIVLSKLCSFTSEEIALAKALNHNHRRRVILLTANELEPNHFFDRTQLPSGGVHRSASSAEDLANATHAIYFQSTGLPPG